MLLIKYEVEEEYEATTTLSEFFRLLSLTPSKWILIGDKIRMHGFESLCPLIIVSGLRTNDSGYYTRAAEYLGLSQSDADDIATASDGIGSFIRDPERFFYLRGLRLKLFHACRLSLDGSQRIETEGINE